MPKNGHFILIFSKNFPDWSGTGRAIRWAWVLYSLLLLICSCLLICSWKIVHEHPMSIFHISSKYLQIFGVKNHDFFDSSKSFCHFSCKKWSSLPIVNSVQMSTKIFGYFFRKLWWKKVKNTMLVAIFRPKNMLMKKICWFSMLMLLAPKKILEIKMSCSFAPNWKNHFMSNLA